MGQGGAARGMLAGALALGLTLLPAAAPAEEAAPILALMAAQCSDTVTAAPLPEGWAPVPAEAVAPLIAGIAGLESRFEQVLARPLADEPDLDRLLARRIELWLAETRDGRMQARLWQLDGTPAVTLLRAAATGSGLARIVHCRLLIEDAPPPLAEAMARRFEILPETGGMQLRIWAGGAEIPTAAGPETHSRKLLILPDWSPRADSASLLVGYGVTRVAR